VADGETALWQILQDAWGEAAGQLTRSPRWVMDRDWYDRLRAALVPAGQEQARADAHRSIMAPVIRPAAGPARCPVCPGTFAGPDDLGAHITQMSDPEFREPAPGDMLMRLPVTVRDGAGAPHIEPGDGP
jgi:hypothetical protein